MRTISILLLAFCSLGPATSQTLTDYLIGPFDCSSSACPGVGLALPLGAQVIEVTLNQQRKLSFTVEMVYCAGQSACSVMVGCGAGMKFQTGDRVWVTWSQGPVPASVTKSAKAAKKSPRNRR